MKSINKDPVGAIEETKQEDAPDSKINLLLDSQILSSVQSCGWNFYAKFIENYRPTGIVNRSMSLGTLTHEVLHSYYEHQIKTGEKDMERAINIVRPHSPNIVEDALDSEMVFGVLRKYHNYYIGDEWAPQYAEEARTKILFEDEDYVIGYVVKIDLVVNGSEFKGWPVDHKTESRYSEPRKNSNQFAGYCWYTGSNNIWVNKIGFTKTATDDRRFRRYLLAYDPEQLKEWVDNAVFWAKQLIIYMQDNNYPKNFTSCDKFSGCTFRPVCEATPGSRTFILRSLFKVGPQWNPLEMEGLDV